MLRETMRHPNVISLQGIIYIFNAWTADDGVEMAVEARH